jgi:hypothetical protein
VSHTIGEGSCKQYGDAHGLVIGYYHWATKKVSMDTVGADLVTSLEAGGWQVTDTGALNYTIRGHGWRGAASVYRQTTGASTPSVLVLVQVVIALSPSPAHT